MHLTRRRLLAASAALTGPALLAGCATPGSTPQPPQPPSPAADATSRLHAFFERHWDETARLFPEWATFRGDHRFGDRLTDVSPAAEAARRARAEAWLAELRAIPREPLAATDRVSRDMFIHETATGLRLDSFEGRTSQRLGSFGAQAFLGALLRDQPVAEAAQREQLLARLAAVPARMAQEIAWLDRGIALGWVSPQPVVRRALAELDAQLAAPLAGGPFMEPFERPLPGLPAAAREAWRSRGEEAVRRHVLPALQQLRRAVVERYAPAAPADGGLLHYPDGPALYEELVREHTTLPLSAAELHALGHAQLRLLAEGFATVARALQLDAATPPAELDRRLRADPAQRLASPEALLEALQAMAKRLDAEMPRLFAELPRIGYGVRAMPAHLGQAADFYNGPPEDGSGPGWFNANVEAWRERTRWELPSLVAHEAVPGHHLQTARGLEIAGLPAFRRTGIVTAFSEGWALYAERLMDEQGFYATPAERFGYLQWQAFRAARLVVDTGLHALGWTPARAAAFLTAASGVAGDFIDSEVARYLSIPGQALAYTPGMLHILELRERARAALGSRFELRRFHNAVIDQGAVPLPVLTAQVEDWIAAERTRG